MNPKLKAYLDIGATSFGVAFVLAVLVAPIPHTWAQAGSSLAAFLVVGAAITRQRLIHPPDGPAVDQLVSTLQTIEPIIVRRVVGAFAGNPDVINVLSRFEAAAKTVPEMHAQMMAAAFSAAHADILANPPPAVLQAVLAQTEAIAASTPVMPPPLPVIPSVSKPM